MNNKLITQRYDLQMALREEYFIKNIEEFVIENSHLFENAESLVALNKIREYLSTRKIFFDSVKEQLNITKKEISACCQHEVLKKNYDQAICLICGHWDFIKDVQYNHFFIEDTDFYSESNIIEIINRIAINNQNIFDVFEDYIAESKENKMKIYRRVR